MEKLTQREKITNKGLNFLYNEAKDLNYLPEGIKSYKQFKNDFLEGNYDCYDEHDNGIYNQGFIEGINFALDLIEGK
jgi:hypothetical protein